MSAVISKTPRAGFLKKQLLKQLNHWTREAPVRIVLGNNGDTPAPSAEGVPVIFIHDTSTLARLILDPEVAFGDGYTKGRIDVHGDLAVLIESILRAAPQNLSNRYSSMASKLLKWAQSNTLRGSRQNIHRHYDLTTDFYQLWLDSRLVYTCAYFPTASTTLEEAQLAKLDYVCRKVRLQPGETVFEAGCGWGALALHMARNYGANVRAFNISHEQIRHAQAKAKEQGLSGRVEFIEDDYRNISGRCDAFVSVGMLEHVGVEHYKELGKVIHRAMGNSGRGLMHFIGRDRPHTFSPWIRKRIFPGAYAPSLGQAMRVLEPYDFSVLDVENLRPHYAKTLEHWLFRFERSADRVREMFDPELVRAWRLYLAGSLASFRTGNLQLFQVVFAGSECRGMPWTRTHLYAAEEPVKQERKWMHATP